jgi:hypothetical protein
VRGMLPLGCLPLFFRERGGHLHCVGKRISE